MVKPFVIAACGRSGTMGTSQLFNRMGVRTSFEEYFVPGRSLNDNYHDWLALTGTHGEVSSLSPPILAAGCANVTVIHQVRNPVAVICSLMGQETWTVKRWWPNVKYNLRHLPALDPNRDDPLTLSMKYWLEWNRLIEEVNPAVRFRVENITKTATAEAVFKCIGAPLLIDHCSTKDCPTNVNHGPRDTSISWNRIPDSQLKYRLFRKAIEYGYTAKELADYCPCGSDCPHCGGPLAQSSAAYMVRIQPQFPRHMRKPEGSGPPNCGYIQGLIDLYQAARVWGGNGVEVGCWTGESAEIACQFLGHLTCVDPWQPPDFSGNEALFDQRMAAYKNVTKLKKPSHVACDDFADNSLDIVYIDGMHDYENVKRDSLAWFPKVKIGGWFAGHDYDDMETHTGVVAAVDELFGPPKLRFTDSSFLFRKTAELAAGVLRQIQAEGA